MGAAVASSAIPVISELLEMTHSWFITLKCLRFVLSFRFISFCFSKKIIIKTTMNIDVFVTTRKKKCHSIDFRKDPLLFIFFDVIYQVWDAVFLHQMKHGEKGWKYDAQWSISDELRWWWKSVSNAWYYFSNKMILEGEIKDAKNEKSKHHLHINFHCIFFMSY